MKRAIVSVWLSSAALSVMTTAAVAQQDVRGVHLREQGLKVIDEKCLVCHNRQRIEDAVRQKKDMEKITILMEKKGAALTDKELQVMNHFWRKKLFKTREEKGLSGQEGGTPPSLK